MVPEQTASGVMGFCVFYLVLFVIGTLTLTAFGLDMESSMGAAAATLGNVGPGMGLVGPTDNYGVPARAGQTFSQPADALRAPGDIHGASAIYP